MERKIVYLPENREDAIRLLKLKYFDKKLNKRIDETPFFLLYLNYAVNNIVSLTGISPEKYDPEEVGTLIRESGKAGALANFLWLFSVENPKDEFPSPECLERAIALAKKVYELRNFFAHLNEKGNGGLVLNRDLYAMIEGELGALARTSLMETSGIRSDKVNKLKLAIPHNDEKTSYELTRKGLIFLTCLALYKDDAIEFCSLFHDMKLPVKQPSIAEMATTKLSSAVQQTGDEPPVNLSKAKALHEMFTKFSMRKGRDLDIIAENFNFTCFADIIGYLNKVPAVCHDYLSLDAENTKLQNLANASTESEDNKRFKYTLHRRFRDRFLSFAAGYCEDFDLFPAIHFKRLDITPVSDRKRYLFGKDQDNRLRMDRHYAIVHDAIRFEWRPKKHYGSVHVGSLRSSISASQMKYLLALVFRKGNASAINDEIDRYFSAYHTVLEKMINAENCNDIFLDSSDPELLKAFSVVTGKTEEELLADDADIFAIAEPFFPANLTRFFLDTDNRMSAREMQAALYNKLAANIDHAEDFLARLNTLDDWRKAPRNPEQPKPLPVCSKDLVKYPPRHCKFSDADLCAWFFRYINLFLTDDQKFRQLPKSKQHRGAEDYEYQFIQKLVGQFNLDQKGLWSVLEKKRPELKNQIEMLKSAINRQLKRAVSSSAKLPKGRRPQPTLTMLARAAAERYSEFCSAELKKYDVEDISASPELLRQECRRFGIRPGMEKDKAALIKTVLRIDIDKWTNSFDYEKKEKRASARPLDSVDHIVSQVPFPNLLMQRFATSVLATSKNLLDADGSFDFNKYLRTFKTSFALRDYYDVSPLIAYTHTHDRTNPVLADDAPGIRRDCFNAVFSAAAISRTVAAIKDVRNQDMLLCRIAFDYWTRFKNENSTIEFDGKFDNPDFQYSVYDVFSIPVLINVGGKKIRIVCNDINRPILAQIKNKKNFAVIVRHMDVSVDQDVFDFYRLVEKMRELSAADRKKRLDIIGLIMKFDSFAPIPAKRYAGLKGAQIHDMEVDEYARKFPGFSAQEYDTLKKARNAVFHDGLDLDVADALAILNKYLS